MGGSHGSDDGKPNSPKRSPIGPQIGVGRTSVCGQHLVVLLLTMGDRTLPLASSIVVVLPKRERNRVSRKMGGSHGSDDGKPNSPKRSPIGPQIGVGVKVTGLAGP
jgi:hypothetical protein